MFNNKLEREDGICSHGGLIDLSFSLADFFSKPLSNQWFFSFSCDISFSANKLFSFLETWLTSHPLTWHSFLLITLSLVGCPPPKNVSLFPWKLSGLKISQCLLPAASACTTWNHRILERGQPEIIYSKLLITGKKRMETWRLSFIFSNTKWSWPQVSMRLHTRG